MQKYKVKKKDPCVATLSTYLLSKRDSHLRVAKGGGEEKGSIIINVVVVAVGIIAVLYIKCTCVLTQPYWQSPNKRRMGLEKKKRFEVAHWQ